MTIPPGAIKDPKSFEMLRVWHAENELQCAINVGIYRDNSKIDEALAWGIILADVTHHISMALNSVYPDDPQELSKHISDSYLKELANPTSKAEGEFVARPVKTAD